MLVCHMTGQTDAYGAEPLDEERKKKKIGVEKQWQKDGENGEKKGLSQGVRQKGADT